VISNSSVSSFAIEISDAVRLWIGSPIARIACAKLLDRMMRRHVAGLEMHLGGAVIVARDEAVEDFGEKRRSFGVSRPHDAEIDRNNAALGVEEQDYPDACRRERSRRAARGAGSLHQRAAERRQIQSGLPRAWRGR
jgi:hypothetical protein